MKVKVKKFNVIQKIIILLTALFSLILMFDISLYSSTLQQQRLHNDTSFCLAPHSDLSPLKDEVIFNNKYIVSFDYIKDSNFVDLIGRKATNVAFLYQSKIPCIPGFCITKRGLKDFINFKLKDSDQTLFEKVREITSTLSKKSTDYEFEEAERKIKYLFDNALIHDEFVRLVEDALNYFKQKFNYDSLAIRSSSISIQEDSLKASFPGMFTTKLNVKTTSQILSAIKEVWLSEWSKSALRYRIENRLADDHFDTGILIQGQLESKISGVYYSQPLGVNPLDHKGEAELTAALGLGAEPIAGKTSTDWYYLDERGNIEKSYQGKQKMAEFPNPEGGVHKRSLTPRNDLLLNHNKIKKINEIAKKACKEIEIKTGLISPYGYDIEWAMDESNKIYIFQIRPIPIPTWSPNHSIFSLLSKISVSRSSFMTFYKLLTKEAISDSEIKKFLPEIIKIRKKIKNNPRLKNEWNIFINILSEKIYFETPFLKIVGHILELKDTIKAVSAEEFSDSHFLNDIFNAHLHAISTGKIPPASIADLRMMNSQIKKLNENNTTNILQAYKQMVLNLRLLHVSPNNLTHTMDLMERIKEPEVSELWENLLIKIFSTWENIERLNSNDILRLLDDAWEEYFQERPEFHKLFIQGIKKLFLDTASDTNGTFLPNLIVNRISDIQLPLILNTRYKELGGEIFGQDLSKAYENIFLDYRYHKICLNPESFFSEALIFILTSKSFKEKSDPIKASSSEKEAFFKFCEQNFLKLLEFRGFWENLSLNKAINILSFIFSQEASTEMKKHAITGLENFQNEDGTFLPAFYKEIMDNTMDFNWKKVPVKYPSLPSMYENLGYDIPLKKTIDLTSVSKYFIRYAERVFSTGNGLTSNIYDLRDAITDAIYSSKHKHSDRTDFLLNVIETIFKIKGYHGNQWRAVYDDGIRPKHPNELIQKATSKTNEVDAFERYNILTNLSNEYYYDNQFNSHQSIKIDPKDLFPAISEKINALLKALKGKQLKRFEITFFRDFINFFKLPDTRNVDVDHTATYLAKEVEKASVYSKDPKVRIAKRFFIEKAQEHIPGSVIAGANWRVIHDDFDDLDTLPQSSQKELIRRLQKLSIDIHNVLHPKILEEAEELLKLISTKDSDYHVSESNNLHYKLNRLVEELRKLYKKPEGYLDDIKFTRKFIKKNIHKKIDEGFRKIKGFNDKHLMFKSFSNSINKIGNLISEKKYTDTILIIESLRVVISKILSEYSLNIPPKKNKAFLTNNNRLDLILLDISLERMTNGIVAKATEKEHYRFFDIYNFAIWLKYIFLINEQQYPEISEKIIRINLLIYELSRKNLNAAKDLWSEIRTFISNLPQRRQILSFRLFEFAAMLMDNFFFKSEIIPISPGSCEGKVRVIDNYESQHNLESIINDPVKGIQPDEILVIREIPRVINIDRQHIPAGIIIEEGSVASHTAAAVRQDESPIPTILFRNARSILNDKDTVKFEVSKEMKKVKVKTDNLFFKVVHFNDYTPQPIIYGRAQGKIKILMPEFCKTKKQFLNIWEQSQITKNDIVVIKSLNFNILKEVLTNRELPSGIIVSEGNRLSPFLKSVNSLFYDLKKPIPVIQIDNATDLFAPLENQLYAYDADENGVQVYRSTDNKSDIYNYIHMAPEETLSNISLGTDYLYNQKCVITNFNGNFKNYKKLMNTLKKNYGEIPLIHTGNYIGSGSNNIKLIQSLFKNPERIRDGKEVILLGKNEILFLKAMLGTLKDLQLFITTCGLNMINEAGLSFMDEKNLTQNDLSDFKGNSSLKKIKTNFLKYGKLYHRENDSLFSYWGINTDETQTPLKYQNPHGEFKEGIVALKVMQFVDFQVNPYYVLTQLTQNNTPLFFEPADKDHDKWKNTINESPAFQKILDPFYVRRIVTGNSSKENYDWKLLGLPKGSILYFDKYGIRYWFPKSKDTKEIQVLEAATAQALAHVETDTQDAFIIRHACHENEIVKLKELLIDLGSYRQKAPMNARWVVVTDPSYFNTVLGGFWYTIDNNRARLGSIGVINEYEEMFNIKKELAVSFFRQLTFEGIQTYKIIGSKSTRSFLKKIKLNIFLENGDLKVKDIDETHEERLLLKKAALKFLEANGKKPSGDEISKKKKTSSKIKAQAA